MYTPSMYQWHGGIILYYRSIWSAAGPADTFLSLSRSLSLLKRGCDFGAVESLWIYICILRACINGMAELYYIKVCRFRTRVHTHMY